MTLLRDNRELLIEFRAGRRAALEAVYWEYVNLVAAVARRGSAGVSSIPVPGVWTDEHADLVHEVFLRAFGQRARLAYDGIHPYRPYLLTICRNLLVDRARARGRELPFDPDTVARLADEQAFYEPEGNWADPATKKAVRDYLAQLNPPLRRVYEARYVKGLSQARAAQTLELSRNRVRTLEHKLRRGLQRALKRAAA